MRLWVGMVIAVAVAGCGARVRETARVVPAAAGHIVVQGAPQVGLYRVPELLWQMGPATNRIVRSLGTEIIIQDPATGAIAERVATEGVPAYFGITADGAVLCVAMRFTAFDAERTRLEVAPTKRLAGWSLDEHRWLWQHDGTANGILLGRDRCGFVRAMGEEAQRPRAFELVVFDARRGTQIGGARTVPGSTTSRTTQQVSANGRWALSPATTQVGFSDGQAPAWTLYRTDDLSVALQWNGPCARFEPDGTLAVDDATRTARAQSFTALGLEPATCTPPPTKIGAPPAAVFTPAPDGSALLAMHVEPSGIALALHEPSGARRLSLTDAIAATTAVATPDGTRAFVVTAGTLSTWSFDLGAPPQRIATGVTDGPFVDRDGRVLAWVAGGAVHRRDIAAGTELAPLRLPETADRWQLAIDDGGTVAALASAPRQAIFVADGGTWRTLHRDAKGTLRTIAFAGPKASRRIVAIDERRGPRAWSLDGKEIASRATPAPWWRELAVSDDGETIATAIAAPGGTQIAIFDDNLAPRRNAASPLFAHSITALHVDRDGISATGAPTLDGCIEERCMLHTLGTGSLVTFDGRGPLAFASDSLLVQLATEREGARLVSRAGATRITFGARGDGWFAYTPSGRYACDGDGCAVFRCNAGGVLVDMNRCATSRAAGIGNLDD